MEDEEPPPKTGRVFVKDLVPCCGLWCCFFSCYTNMPDCLGTVCETQLCCSDYEALCCKTSKEEGTICKCISFNCDLIPLKTCCMSRSQACCIDVRAAFPAHQDIPCICNILCCTFCYQYKTTCNCASDIRTIHSSVFMEIAPDEPKWQQAMDPRSKRVYFINTDTGATQWEKPDDFDG